MLRRQRGLGAWMAVVSVMCLAAGLARGQEAPSGETQQVESGEDEASQMARIEDQLRTLAERNQALQNSYSALSQQYQQLIQQLGLPAPPPPVAATEQEAGTAPTAPPSGRRAAFLGGLSTYALRASEEPRRNPQQLMEDYMASREVYKPDMEPVRYSGGVYFQDGLQFRSSDGYFTIQFHNLSQLDGRLFDPTGDPLSDNFNIPRQRWYFQGDISPYATFYTVINRGFGGLDVLDSWVD